MADTTTTNLLLTKPEVGASTDTWGTKSNTNWDSVDSLFAADGTGTSVGLNIGAGKTLKVAGTTDFSANLTFTGTGNRITGDFSNATTANKVMLQTSTTNGATVVNVIPAGSGNSSGFNLFNDSGFTNSARFDIGLLNAGSEARLSSTIVGAGTYVPMTFLTGGSERVRIDTSGSVGIGTSSPSSKFDVVGGRSTFSANSENFSVYLRYNNSTNGFYIGSPSADAMVFSASSGAERMRITSTGLVGIGTSSPSAKLTVVSAATPILSTFTGTLGGYDSYSTDDASGARFLSCFSSGGSVIGSITRVTTTAAVTFNTTSDYRLKTVIGSVTGQGERIDSLKPIDYQWTEGGQNSRGFLAHEFQEVYAGSVSGTKDAVDADGNPVYQAMQASSSEVIADLVAEIQSLRQRLAAAGI